MAFKRGIRAVVVVLGMVMAVMIFRTGALYAIRWAKCEPIDVSQGLYALEVFGHREVWYFGAEDGTL